MPAFTDQDWIDLHAMSVQHFPIIFSWQSAMSKVCKHFRQMLYFVPSGWLRMYVNITLRRAKGKPRWNLSYFWSLGFRSKSHISQTWQTFRDSFQTDIVWNVDISSCHITTPALTALPSHGFNTTNRWHLDQNCVCHGSLRSLMQAGRI